METLGQAQDTVYFPWQGKKEWILEKQGLYT